MGDNKLSAAPPNSRPQGPGADPSRTWPPREGPSSRHGAISRQLFTYSHYKSWADRMRTSWKKEDEEAESGAASTGTTR
jgi:hypothetical protein